MKHFFANLVAMFFVSKKLRRRVRAKIMGVKQNIPNPDELKIKAEQLMQTENQITEKQQALDNLEKKYNYQYLKSEWLLHNNGELPLPGRFKEYDLIFGIGATCISTEMLDFFRLRRFTNPFDWTGGMEPENWQQQPDIHRDTRFHEKIQEICNKFKNTLNPEYYKHVSQWHGPRDPHHNIVNIKTRVRYMHEFPANKSIMQHMPEFMNKMERRINNLYNAIEQSKKILVVWIASIGDQRAVLEQPVPAKDIKWAVNQMKKLYPDKEFDFVFFEPDGTLGKFEYKKIMVATGAYRILSNHFFVDSEYNFISQSPEHRPHTHVVSEMLDNIHLSENAFKLPDSGDA